MRTLLMAAALLGGMAVSPAFAFQCPADMAAIDAALPSAQLSEADRARVTELRQQGEAAHESGNHDQSVALLAEAKQILGIQ